MTNQPEGRDEGDGEVLEVTVGRERLRLLTLPERDTGALFWHLLWPAGRALVAHLINAPRTVAGVRALELGCGTALVGIAAARLGARVTLSDLDPGALALARRNAALNDVADAVDVAVIDWRAPPPLEPFELILGSDLVYEPFLAPMLLGALEALLAPGGRALLADPIRSSFTRFLDLARARGFTFRQDIDDLLLPGRRTPQRVGVYTLWRR